jgi:hypothetical protein
MSKNGGISGYQIISISGFSLNRIDPLLLDITSQLLQ